MHKVEHEEMTLVEPLKIHFIQKENSFKNIHLEKWYPIKPSLYWFPKIDDGRKIVASGNSSLTANSPAYWRKENKNILSISSRFDLLLIEEIVKVFVW